ncbi:UDP-3-O-(3-hydroxymyristoyl)glucosamine N-acyltransferase [Desulfohalobiaceae bacterium Ax17]|uniref:UDP-3-O-(3-hydroxymyristoyl)glucosamine N-acyltransferase n=1 Tax=Desulfovulcanus ferrireducens TaxID=2831190 RepID=UPI00207BAC72|nr:UDP-3-O-(3-hydroxymyristoyl)glucosamine N-acyltransferase [Desulfovulcanus ferrireducens]MBT8763271.1 UDP-3-O-(3-hydroxymyristoyl)glucosamine N-acyltransferase [Desulfovulcanus ferrireducens]
MLLSELAQKLGLKLVGDDLEITGVNTLDKAKEDEISFLANPKYIPLLKTTKAGAVIVDEEHATKLNRALISANPYLDFVRTVQLFAKPQGSFTGQSPLAYIHEAAEVHPSATIYPHVYIGPGARIGENTQIFPSCYIGENSVIGDNCIIYPNVSIMARTIIGNKVIIHAGVVIGSDGFGFAQGELGLEKFPQVGQVIIEDNVEIGANTTIDRAALGETRIGQGTKIDNLVQIGHNVKVGENSILVAQVGIAGSTTLGKNVILAGQVGVAGHLEIGDNCRVAAQAGVGKTLPPNTDVGGSPAMEHSAYLRSSVLMPKLPELFKKIRQLEKEILCLKEENNKK